MASNLVQLSYKPGIQRDGTPFQGDFCSEGQWIRFQRGKIKKIGGMKGVGVNNNLVASEIALYPFNAGQIYYYICAPTGVFGGTVDTSFNDSGNVQNFIGGYNNAMVQWQAETVIINDQRTVVFLATNNAPNIAQDSASTIYSGQIGMALILLDNANANVNQLINGGMCYSNPYLFLYGSNGLVQYSRNNDPLNFTADAAAGGGSITISNDKVIWGRAIRGGPNAPSVLFWTLSTVVRITNTATGEEPVAFQIDVISKSSSILSSKCVVEYDGLFFWTGTDRFFVYNGIVQEIVNNTNLNYFYDNIDMDYRQKVFGVKNTRYGEIWWFYPEKIGAPGRNAALPAGTNTRALIYNKRENTWYDTAIYRDCGTFSEDFGYLVTYGMSLTNPTVGTTNLWRHEYGINETIPATVDSSIDGGFTTPIFGWSSFNPVNSGNAGRGQLVDRWIEIRRIEPDFVYGAPPNSMNIVVNTQNYAQSEEVNSDPFIFTNQTEKVDMRVQGRQMSLTFSGDNYFEMGNIMMLVGIGDGQ